MYLSRYEEKILNGEEGEAKRRALELLVVLGDIAGAEKLVSITNAQISGVSYKTISDAGLEFLEEFAQDAKVSVKATLNPLGMDRENWKELGISENFSRNQLKILDAYSKMGVELTCTCTPYFVGNRPARDEHISWAESSAVVFANSVLGARTNKEGGPGALAAAIIGKTPLSGLHLEENRRPKIGIKIDAELSFDDFTLIGNSAGKKIGQEIPLITGISPTEDEHKAMGAAMAASGSASIYHFDSDPSACGRFETIEEAITIDRRELDSGRDALSTADENVDIVTLGCPHLSVNEIGKIAKYLKNKEPRKDQNAWFCVSRGVAEKCPDEMKILRRFGKIACDTCMVVAPLEDISGTTATDSAKAAIYLPTLCKQKVLFSTRDQLLEMISK